MFQENSLMRHGYIGPCRDSSTVRRVRAGSAQNDKFGNGVVNGTSKPCPDTCMVDGCGMGVQADNGAVGRIHDSKRARGMKRHNFVKTRKLERPLVDIKAGFPTRVSPLIEFGLHVCS